MHAWQVCRIVYIYGKIIDIDRIKKYICVYLTKSAIDF